MQRDWNNPQQASKGTRFYSPGLLIFWGLTKILQGQKGNNLGLQKGFQAHLISKQFRRKGKRDPNMPGTITLTAKAMTAGATTGVGHLSEGDGLTCLSVLHLYLPRGRGDRPQCWETLKQKHHGSSNRCSAHTHSRKPVPPASSVSAPRTAPPITFAQSRDPLKYRPELAIKQNAIVKIHCIPLL